MVKCLDFILSVGVVHRRVTWSGFTSLNGYWKMHCKEARVEVRVPVRRCLLSPVLWPLHLSFCFRKQRHVSHPFWVFTSFIALGPWLWNYRTVQNTDIGKALFTQGTKDFCFLSVLQVSGEMWPLKYWNILNVLYIVVWSGGAGINFSLVALLFIAKWWCKKSSHSVIYWWNIQAWKVIILIF